jgi:4-hydroxybenzoate polyprenyltransferase
MLGNRNGLGGIYDLSLVAVALLFARQQYLIRHRERAACFKAFLNNNWVGAAVLLGIIVDYYLR